MQINHIKIRSILGTDELELSPKGFTTISVEAELHTKAAQRLADRENDIGNVQLPTECVRAHPESMRAAIDAAMRES